MAALNGDGGLSLHQRQCACDLSHLRPSEFEARERAAEEERRGVILRRLVATLMIANTFGYVYLALRAAFGLP